jgi:acylphosphatase
MMERQQKPTARLHATIHGHVQGVSYRYYAVRAAQRLGLTGWIANRWDGTVETIAEGQREALDEFQRLLRRGSPASDVRRVDVEWGIPTSEYDRFKVRYL